MAFPICVGCSALRAGAHLAALQDEISQLKQELLSAQTAKEEAQTERKSDRRKPRPEAAKEEAKTEPKSDRRKPRPKADMFATCR